MSIELKGVDSLLKKLDKISHLDCKEAVGETSDMVVNAIKSGCSFAPHAKDYIGVCRQREGEHYYYMDVGLSEDNAKFESYKEAYFHNYGYKDKGWKFGEKGPYIDMHKMWFPNAVNGIEPEVKAKIKAKIEQELKEGWGE